MPRIPEYVNTQNVNPEPLESTAYSVARYGRQAGADISEGSRALAKGFADMGQAAAQSETLALAKKMSDTDLQLDSQYLQLKQGTDPNDPAAMSKLSSFYTDNVQPAYDELGRDLNSKQAREYFQTHSIDRSREIGARALNDYTELHGVAAKANFEGIVNNAGASATLNPASIGTQLDAIDRASKALPGQIAGPAAIEAKQHVLKLTGDSLIEQAVNTGTMDSIAAAKKVLLSPDGTYVKNANAADIVDWQTRLHSAEQQFAGVQYAGVAAQWDDRLEAARGGDTESLAWLQQNKANLTGSTPKERALEGAKRDQAIEDVLPSYQASRSLVGKSIPDLQEVANRVVPPEGERTPQDKADAASASVAKSIIAKYNASPFDYAVTNNQAIASAYSTFAKQPSPQTFQQYADRMMAWQKSFDPGAKGPREILPPETADAIRQQIGDITQTGEGASRAGQTLAQWSQITGSYWPTVANELMQKHVLNGDQFAAAQLYQKPSAAALAPVLLSASTMSNDQRRALHGVTEEKALPSAIKAFQPLAASLANIPDAAQTITANVYAVAHLMQVRGETGDSAAQKLADSVLNDEFDFRDDTLRIPKAAGLDSASVGRGAQRMRQELGPYEIDVPRSFSGLGAGDQRANYINRLESAARWYTTADGKGATLYPSPGAGSPVTARGKPITLTWAQLSAMGQ